MESEERYLLSLIQGWAPRVSENTEQNTKLKVDEKISTYLLELEDEFTQEQIIQSLISLTVERKKKIRAQAAASTDRFTSEKELKHWFQAHMSTDFHIYGEVWGVHLSENVNVRIDYILYPKPHLIEQGFEQEPFGVEVKYFKQEDKFTHKTSRGVWQTISYNDCLFNLKGREFKTKFCLLFSNLSFSEEAALIKNLGYEWEDDQSEWRGMIHVANHAGVGTISIDGNKVNLSGWRMHFAGGTYFSRTTYNGDSSYKLSNANMINKVRVGNF